MTTIGATFGIIALPLEALKQLVILTVRKKTKKTHGIKIIKNKLAAEQASRRSHFHEN